MRKKKRVVCFLLLILLVTISGCKKNNPQLVLENEVDKVKIVVIGSGAKWHWTANDQNFIKTLIGNTNLLFGKTDENVEQFNAGLDSTQKNYTYSYVFYKKGKKIQTIKISKGNQVKIDKKSFTIKKSREMYLKSIKNQLLIVSE